jgi:hypothetical protein
MEVTTVHLSISLWHRISLKPLVSFYISILEAFITHCVKIPTFTHNDMQKINQMLVKFKIENLCMWPVAYLHFYLYWSIKESNLHTFIHELVSIYYKSVFQFFVKFCVRDVWVYLTGFNIVTCFKVTRHRHVSRATLRDRGYERG